MKTLIMLLLLGSHLDAADWTIVDATATQVSDTEIRVHVKMKNTSGTTVELREDELSKGNALANYYYISENDEPHDDRFASFEINHWMLYARPCHSPVNHLTIKPGETVTVSMPELNHQVGNKVRLVLIGKKEEFAVGHLAIPSPMGEPQR